MSLYKKHQLVTKLATFIYQSEISISDLESRVNLLISPKPIQNTIKKNNSQPKKMELPNDISQLLQKHKQKGVIHLKGSGSTFNNWSAVGLPDPIPFEYYDKIDYQGLPVVVSIFSSVRFYTTTNFLFLKKDGSLNKLYQINPKLIILGFTSGKRDSTSVPMGENIELNDNISVPTLSFSYNNRNFDITSKSPNLPFNK